MKLPIRKVVFDEKIPFGFEILSLDSADARSKENLRAPHRASFYLIIWFQKGNPFHVVDFNPVAVKPDSFLFIRKDAVQFFDQTNDFTSRIILFTEDFYGSTEKDHQALNTSPLFIDLLDNGGHVNIAATPRLKELWTLLENEVIVEADGIQPALLQKLLSSFLLLSERERLKQGIPVISRGAQADLFIAFKSLLEIDFKTEKTVCYYTGRLFVSDKVLTHALNAIVGKTPKQIIDERVILEAKRLLVHSPIAVKSIALSLGFEEPTNFNKFFKKHCGKTPLEFRLGYIESQKGAKVSS